MEQLGIEPSLLLAQLVNFSIIIFVLSKLLYKPILAMLEKRKHEIEEGLALTEKMRMAEEKMRDKQDKMLETARKDARDLVEQAKKDAQETEKQIVAEAHKGAEAIIEKAKSESQNQHELMLKDVRKEAIDLAVAMTKRLTTSVLSDTDQHRLLGKQLKELEDLRI
jgi:F-type H+-transporting ATPase subunit b